MNVGTIAYPTEQGIAHLARDFYRHGVVNRVLLYPHPHYPNYPERHTYAYHRSDWPDFLKGLDILFLFETGLDWRVVREAVRRQVRIVVMPMYEYTPKPFPVPVDLFICPSLLDQHYYPDGGMEAIRGGRVSSIYLPVPVDQPWKLRSKALSFVHNAGHGQHSFAKGTPQVVEAMEYVESPIRMLIRGQPGERQIQRLFHEQRSNPRVELVFGDLPEGELYATGDVFVYPERWNGLSLPLQEAYASGMLVMASDRFPANSWLPREPLIPVESYEEVRIATTFQKARIEPRMIARKIDEWYGKDITEFSLRGARWAEENSWAVLKPKYLKALEQLL